jgi:hypothetical protein
MTERPRWLAYRSKDGIVESHFEEDDTNLSALFDRAMAWSRSADPASRCSSEIRLLDTFLSAKSDYWLLEQVMVEAQAGTNARLLVASPECDFAVARARSLDSTPEARTRIGLQYIAEAVLAATRAATPDWTQYATVDLATVAADAAASVGVEVRFYHDAPSGPLYFLRDLVLLGRYASGKSAHRSPWLLAVDDPRYDGDLYDQLSREFEEIWEAATGTLTHGSSEIAAVGIRRDALEVVKSICDRLPRSAAELAPALELNDEKAVVKLLAAILRAQFETVLTEEVVPSSLGRSGRVDLLLPDEAIGIEVKFPHATRSTKDCVDELVLAQSRYGQHNDLSVLVCLIYDPNHVVQNRSQIVRRLESIGSLTTHVVVAP